jgi:hypothetical protein
MESFASVLAAAMLSLVAMLLGYGLAVAWRRVLRAETPLPFYGMLRREGLSPGEACEAMGLPALAVASRRCAFCASGAQCRARLAAGAPAVAGCPNAELFAALRRPRF